jgi:LysR family transcriptional activator of nhaA
LTEAGRIALGYAERIFATGNELVATLTEGRHADRQVLRIGAVATLSRNFQESFVRPLLERRDIDLILQSGSLSDLLARVSAHTVDLVLSNRPVLADAQADWRCRRIARQQVSLVGRPRKQRPAFRFPEDLADRFLLLPSVNSEIRTSFDLLCEQLGIRIQVLAEVDDMAMLRLLARDTDAIALLPSVVVRDELRDGQLQEYCAVPSLVESFYAITVRRHFQPPLLKALLSKDNLDALAAQLQH